MYFGLGSVVQAISLVYGPQEISIVDLLFSLLQSLFSVVPHFIFPFSFFDFSVLCVTYSCLVSFD